MAPETKKIQQKEAPETVIRADHVAKHFKVFLDKGHNMTEKVLFRNRRRFEERQVLKDISLDIRRGEAVGLVGENGCGKSTMLKLLSRIMYPDAGKIEITGRVSALIELGAGFHPDMSGRENIYTNAAIFGLTRAEIDERLQTIIDFSELGDYIDNPVRTYSSGMYMRLAFSVAINVDADILLIDEILAVGDVAFQAKCFNKLREIKRKGATIVIVSHSLGQIEQICDRSYWIESGLIREEGVPGIVHQHYLRYMGERSGLLGQKTEKAEEPAEQEAAEAAAEGETPAENAEAPGQSAEPEADPKRWGSRDLVIKQVRILNGKGMETDKLESGAPFTIEIRYRVRHTVEEAAFGIGIFRNDGVQVYGVNTEIDRIPVKLAEKEGTIRFRVPVNNLLEGAYLLDTAIHRPDGFPYDYWRECAQFDVFSVTKDAGVMRLDHTWVTEEA